MSEILEGTIRVGEILAFLAGDAYLPKRAAAGYLGMSLRKLEGLGIEHYRVGGQLYYRRSVLDQFMQAHREGVRGKADKPEVGSLHALMSKARKAALAEEKNKQAGGREG